MTNKEINKLAFWTNMQWLVGRFTDLVHAQIKVNNRLQLYVEKKRKEAKGDYAGQE